MQRIAYHTGAYQGDFVIAILVDDKLYVASKVGADEDGPSYEVTDESRRCHFYKSADFRGIAKREFWLVLEQLGIDTKDIRNKLGEEDDSE